MPTQKFLSPLSLPKWGERPEKEETASNFLGIANEALRDDAGAAEHIIIEVRGLAKFPSGAYKLAYIPGTALGTYLKRVKLRYAAMTNAVYDYSNLEKGRCRMSYIPDKGSRIVIGPPAIGPASHLQRTNIDAMEVARNMGRAGKGPTPLVVERKK